MGAAVPQSTTIEAVVLSITLAYLIRAFGA